MLTAAMRHYSGVAMPGDRETISREYERFHRTIRPLIDAA
jgi:hypothetical protein